MTELGSHAPDVPMTSRSNEEGALARYPRWVQDVVAAFPLVLRAQATRDLPRALFQIATIGGPMDTRPGPVLWDVGGGTSLFPVLAAAAGFRTTVVDIFDENPPGKEVLKSVFPRYGIRAVKADIIADSPEFDRGVDIFACIDSIEHWHHSPKAVLHRMVHSLRPGGLVFIGMPNCVNLRKRLTVPFGYGKWTAMAEWYEKPRFNSHVREPDVDDLRYIARDLELDRVTILGRNWSGYLNDRAWVRVVTPFVDHVLRLRPSLCSDLYLLGSKPTGHGAGAAGRVAED